MVNRLFQLDSRRVLSGAPPEQDPSPLTVPLPNPAQLSGLPNSHHIDERPVQNIENTPKSLFRRSQGGFWSGGKMAVGPGSCWIGTPALQVALLSVPSAYSTPILQESFQCGSGSLVFRKCVVLVRVAAAGVGVNPAFSLFSPLCPARLPSMWHGPVHFYLRLWS